MDLLAVITRHVKDTQTIIMMVIVMAIEGATKIVTTIGAGVIVAIGTMGLELEFILVIIQRIHHTCTILRTLIVTLMFIRTMAVLGTIKRLTDTDLINGDDNI